MYAYAQNYYIRQINRGESRYLHEILQLYKQLLANELLLDQGMIAHEHYKNITTVGLRTKAFDWVLEFLEHYRSRLHPDIRENAYTYNLAAYHYERQQYREAMKLLNHVTFTDVFYHLSAKSILLKIYFELRDDDSLRYHFQAFEAFIKRNKQIPGYHTQTHRNLLRFAKKLWRIRRKQDKYGQEADLSRRLADLEDAMNETRAIANSSWLRAEISRLKAELNVEI